MKKISDYENKKVLVLGLARSGVSAARLLDKLGAIVTVNDFKNFDENPEAQLLLDEGIRVITGGHPVELLDEDFELIVKNPGILYSNPMLVAAVNKQIPIITEVELAYQISEADIIGITGTNGKTTTTTMIAEMLNYTRENNGKAYLAGNIGFPASSVAQEATSEDELVTELSSFQLLGIRTFRPKIAVITNIYSAHLDYHGSREEYVKAKWRIQENMTSEDILILNGNQAELRELAQNTKAHVVTFSTEEKTNGAYLLENTIFYGEEMILSIDEMAIVGMHNVENALAAVTAAKLRGVENEAICEVLRNFHGVEHRTQFVGSINERKFYNDSKATNILATKMALSGFENDRVILLAGGLDRGNDFDELLPAIYGLKGMVTFGETAEKLMLTAEEANVGEVLMTENAEVAVRLAYEMSSAGDVILLSPANASWDQYPNFEVRGEKFVQAVKQLAEEVGAE
ncbi:UDP-N-acetylmuramoyl-L-alanine--D-glutamate ligase [Pilibacter termitis]|uniref:UDP-N-acetylmuramoyl-L-alanine--D-glutamate ligase n=1 Tax=Pilibacter termitis TaxID=263852 RepID=UPI000999FABA|nr:UDP-N-acetylmuramoyl-L-alanine--D-glutamate ligase [Pilibacter termitis]